MKKVVLFLLGMIAVASQAAVIDDFNDTDLSEYTINFVLDHAAGYSTTYSSPSGTLQATKTNDTSPEQVTLLRDDYSLSIGDTLRIDTSVIAGGYMDFGLAVAKSADLADVVEGETGDVRDGFLTIYFKTSWGSIGYAGWDSGNIGGNSGAASPAYSDVTGLYISRLSTYEFEAGYSTASGDSSVVTWTCTNSDIGNAVGFYSDLRTQDATVGNFDNLTIVPEPATMALLGLGGLVAIRKRK